MLMYVVFCFAGGPAPVAAEAAYAEADEKGCTRSGHTGQARAGSTRGAFPGAEGGVPRRSHQEHGCSAEGTYQCSRPSWSSHFSSSPCRSRFAFLFFPSIF